MQAVFTYEPNLRGLSINKAEIYRYLGYTKLENTENEKITSMVDEILENVIENSVPKVCYKKNPVSVSEEIDFGFMKVKSEALAYNLKDCFEVVIFAATIGIYTDRQLQKESILSPARACIYQAVGATVIEAVCDDFNQFIDKQESLSGNRLKPRFSPGYGDFPLDYQKEVFQLLECSKRIGITLTEGNLMMPTKSVTAVIGLTTQERQSCHQKTCSSCEKIDCEFRVEE